MFRDPIAYLILMICLAGGYWLFYGSGIQFNNLAIDVGARMHDLGALFAAYAVIG